MNELTFHTAIVDDDPILRFILSKTIKNIGFSTYSNEFQNGREFIEWLNNYSGKSLPIILFLDLTMPIMDGWQVLEILKNSHLNNCRIIIISSSVSKSERSRACAYKNVIKFISKPITSFQLDHLMKTELKDLFKN